MNSIINKDCLDGVRDLSDSSIDCVVTSPPYWGLRDYGVAGQIGREDTIDEYLDRLADLFDEIYRVLKSTGTVWLNIGDTYSKVQVSAGRCAGVKQKELIGIPWRVALELQARGWFLRSDIIWHKTNPLPESVRDRPTKSHEYLFLLSKRAKYYYDYEAIKEEAIYGSDDRKSRGDSRRAVEGANRTSPRKDVKKGGFGGKTAERKGHEAFRAIRDKRNKRSVWAIPTMSYTGAHFAVFPERLIEPCILAGCPPGGVVLDPFLGSGTTAIVALKTGRSFVGIEINPGYCGLAKKRIIANFPLLAGGVV